MEVKSDLKNEAKLESKLEIKTDIKSEVKSELTDENDNCAPPKKEIWINSWRKAWLLSYSLFIGISMFCALTAEISDIVKAFFDLSHTQKR